MPETVTEASDTTRDQLRELMRAVERERALEAFNTLESSAEWLTEQVATLTRHFPVYSRLSGLVDPTDCDCRGFARQLEHAKDGIELILAAMELQSQLEE